MNQYFKIIIAIITLVTISSCSSAKKLVKETDTKLDKKKNTELMMVLDSLSKIRPNNFYTKISTKFNDNSQNISFKTTIKMKKDSAMTANMSFLGIPVYNTLINKDSLILLDRRKKCYSEFNLSYLKQSFGIEFEHQNIEEILLGMPLEFSMENKYFQFNESELDEYVLSSHRKHKIKRSEKKLFKNPVETNGFNDEEMIFKYYISSDLKSLSGIQLESKQDSIKINISYLKREMVEGYSIPKEVEITMTTPKNTILVELNYEKSEVNIPQKIELVKPENYEICN